MVTNINEIISNLLSFYDFEDKIVVAVGSGGGQLIEYARPARQVLAVDSDAEALEELKKSLRSHRLENKFGIYHSDFDRTSLKGDVVLFEFCLHEMKDPIQAIMHARASAPDVVIVDHLPDSEWAYYVAEDEKAWAVWDAVHKCGTKKRATFAATQYFGDYRELQGRVEPMGDVSVHRIRRFSSVLDIQIPMRYGLALI
jgi:hypothetical protein